MEDASILARTVRFHYLYPSQNAARTATMRLPCLFVNDPHAYNTGMYE